MKTNIIKLASIAFPSYWWTNNNLHCYTMVHTATKSADKSIPQPQLWTLLKICIVYYSCIFWEINEWSSLLQQNQLLLLLACLSGNESFIYDQFNETI